MVAGFIVGVCTIFVRSNVALQPQHHMPQFIGVAQAYTRISGRAGKYNPVIEAKLFARVDAGPKIVSRGFLIHCWGMSLV